ncbi:MAG TPA: M23 family metallopeptidase [Candidatus Limnocylindria bacterium]|nr:M23 family metallopeptidase [Candidatus Limnocylindria bacterium]
MRILLAIVAVSLFGAVAVAATASRAEAPQASPTAPPQQTLITTGSDSPLPADPVERPLRAGALVASRFIVPIEGAEIPEELELLPGAPRDYREGVHEGIDFPAPEGTSVRAAAAGTVIRVDTSFVDWTTEEQESALNEALALGYTPPPTLDRIRGRQVWIDHGRGVVSRYAHLSATEPLLLGQRVEEGTLIGAVGSSGHPQGGPHLHFEVRVGEDYYGAGQSGDALVRAVSRLFR